MPTSSTVWCRSTARSPVGGELEVEHAVLRERLEHVVEERDARSRPGSCRCRRDRARRGSRSPWSCACTLRAAPFAHSSNSASRAASRSRRARRIFCEPQVHRPAVAGQALDRGEPHHVEPELAQLRRLEADHARALEEVVHAERREEARGAAGRQHVVRAGEIVADRHRRVVAEEDRARVRARPWRSARRRRSRSRGARARTVRERDALGDVLRHDDRAARRRATCARSSRARAS